MSYADTVAHTLARQLAEMGFRVERTGTALRASPDTKAERAYHFGLDIAADVTEMPGDDEVLLEIRHMLPERVQELIDPYDLPDTLEDLQETLQELDVEEQLGTIIIRGGLMHHSEEGLLVFDLAVAHGGIIARGDYQDLEQLRTMLAELGHYLARLQGWIDDWMRELAR